MKRFKKVYLEITNVCNLKCAFCPGTKRKKQFMETDTLEALLKKIQPYTDYVYYHLMGEPLLHPNLAQHLQSAANLGLKVILTTNGTLLEKTKDILLHSPALHKVNISLHSFEANESGVPFDVYLEQCSCFAKDAEGKIIVAFRLWNEGGMDSLNENILNRLKIHFPDPWVPERKGIRIGQKVYLHFGDKFDWPDKSAPYTEESVFCYGLQDQIGILCDGTVVPCCLDHEGDMILGNLLDESMEQILSKPATVALQKGLSCGCPTEELCRRCGFARRFHP